MLEHLAHIFKGCKAGDPRFKQNHFSKKIIKYIKLYKCIGKMLQIKKKKHIFKKKNEN